MLAEAPEDSERERGGAQDDLCPWEFRVQGLGYRLQDVVFRAQGAGFKVQLKAYDLGATF